MSRLNTERQKKLEPKRIKNAMDEITDLGYDVSLIDGNELQFEFKGSIVRFWPYTGWASGKTIKDGRGFMNLYNQIK
jgi:hypothetical protein